MTITGAIDGVVEDAAQTKLRPRLEEVRTWPATVSVPTACRPLGISTSHGYALVARDEFPARVIRAGNCYRVVTASLVRTLADEPSDAA